MNETKKPVVVDPDMLAPETLISLIDSFIMREGTDYGWDEVSLEKKREQVQKHLSRNEIKIVFDAETESVTLLSCHQARKLINS